MKNLTTALSALNDPLTNLGQVIDDIYREDESKGVTEEVTEANIREIVRKAICDVYAPSSVSLSFYALATISCEMNELLALMQEVQAETGAKNDD